MIPEREWLAVCLCLLAGCAGEKTPLERLREHVAELRAEGRFDPAPEDPDAARWFARLDELDDRAEEVAPWEEYVGAPHWWEPEEREDLRRVLDDLEPWFAGIEELLADPACVATLERGEILAQREPKLLFTRNRTNLLCGRAIVAADEGRDAEAVEAFSQALDLARVVDDGSLIGSLVSDANESIVVVAIQHVLASPLDAPALQSALDPLLAAADDPRRFERVLDSELVFLMRHVENVFEDMDPDTVEESLAFLETTPEELVGDALKVVDLVDDMLRARDLCMDLDSYDETGLESTFHAGGRSWHSSRVRRHVTRMALAVAAHGVETGAWPASLAEVAPRFEGGLPAEPCGHRKLAYEANDEEVRIWSADRVGSHKGSGHVDLHVWAWPADAFDEASRP